MRTRSREGPEIVPFRNWPGLESSRAIVDRSDGGASVLRGSRAWDTLRAFATEHEYAGLGELSEFFTVVVCTLELTLYRTDS